MLVKSSIGNSLLTLLQQEGWDTKPFFSGSPFVGESDDPFSVFQPDNELLVVMNDGHHFNTTASTFSVDLGAHGADTDVRSIYKKTCVKVTYQDPVKKPISRKKYY
ncbi:hypothetical protein KBA63_05315 [Candidatus Woesebacteria bacterium]|nr:hypothetical protein [Candidatus Woesebacteria bacterium]MBP9687664.1 hypothetical protein [Candidatus Woesebacteria bacterium]